MPSNSQEDVLLASMQAILISNPDMMAAMQQFLTGQLPSYFVKVPGFGNVAPSKARVDAEGVYSPPHDIKEAPKFSVPMMPMVICRDTRTFRAAQSLCEIIHSNCQDTAEQLSKVHTARFQDHLDQVAAGLSKAEEYMSQSQEYRKLLCELIPDIREKLPKMVLKIPPFLVEFNGYTRSISSEVAMLQDFVLRKNIDLVMRLTKKTVVLMGWLTNAVESMEAVEAIARMDGRDKEMQLNVFRMGCFERLAVATESKPDMMGESELTFLLASPAQPCSSSNLLHTNTMSSSITPSSSDNCNELLAMMKAMLVGNPAMMDAMHEFMLSQSPPVKVPGFGIIHPSNASFSVEGVYTLPAEIPPTHKLTSPPEPLLYLDQFIPAYLDLVKRVAELKAYQEAAAAKKEVVEDLEKGITTDRKWLDFLEEQQQKDTQDVQKIQGFSFKSVKAKISGKYDEAKQKELEELEKTKAEKASREQSLREKTAKLEKAKIAYEHAKADAVALSATQKELIRFMEQAMAAHDTNETAFLLSAIQDGKSLSSKVGADLKAFQAALQIASKMVETMKAAKTCLFKCRQDFWGDTFKGQGVEYVEEAERLYVDVRKDADLLIKIVPALEMKLPEFRLRVPDLVLQFGGKGDFGEFDHEGRMAAFKIFIMDKNFSICTKEKERLEAAVKWLRESIDSIVFFNAMVRSDLERKSMEMNVYRMACFEAVAATQSSKPRLDKSDLIRLLAPGLVAPGKASSS
ncbi:hypothetical protein HDU97_002686 [Phlyctochytrium planicorne]|nr:hypothetical protein HDU97_002686 [Phlyctochytrium planicorne]